MWGVFAAKNKDGGKIQIAKGTADHVGGEKQGDILLFPGHVSGEPLRAEEHAFLEVEGDKGDGAARGDVLGGELFGDFEQHGDAGGVVIGAGEDFTAPNAKVVVMGREDDDFVSELGVRAGEDGPKVAPHDTFLAVLVGIGNVLDVPGGAALLAREHGLEPGVLEMFEDVLGGGVRVAPRATLLIGGGEIFDMGPNVLR